MENKYSIHLTFFEERFHKLYPYFKKEYGHGMVLFVEQFRRLSVSGMVTTTFTIMQNNAKIIYGMLYSLIDSENKGAKSVKSSDSRVQHVHYCIGPSLLSRDGEYRGKFGNIQTLFKLLEQDTALGEIMIQLKDYLMDKAERLKWEFDNECFYPDDNDVNIQEVIESEIIRSQIYIFLLIGNWFTELFDFVHNRMVIHTNKIYKQVMGFNNPDEIKRDYEFFQSLIKDFSKEDLQKLYDFFSETSTDADRSTMMGQKIIPLNIQEVKSPLSIRCKPWREILVGFRINRLFVNRIVQNFAYTGMFTMLDFMRKTIFDNYIQYVKLEHSEIAEVIVRKLKEAQRVASKFEDPIPTQFASEAKTKADSMRALMKNVDTSGGALTTGYKHDTSGGALTTSGVDEDTVASINEYLSEKFKTLHEKIQDPVDYAQAEIIMSKYCLMFNSSYVGRTFYDALNIIRHDKQYNANIGDISNNPTNFSKYLFDIIYGLYAVNIRGIIHGDLHLNNFTIGSPMHTYEENMVQVYEVTKEHTFVFPTMNKQAYIIDFSRAIIRPSQLDSFYTHLHYDGNNKRVFDILPEDEKNVFEKEQSIRIRSFYNRFFPEFYDKNKTSLYILTTQLIERVFPLLGAIDTYMMCSGILSYYKSQKKTCNPKNIQILNDLIKICEHFLLDKVLKAQFKEHPDDFANLECLLYFSEYLIDDSYSFEGKKIVELVSAIKEETFDLSDNLPPDLVRVNRVIGMYPNQVIVREFGLPDEYIGKSKEELFPIVEEKLRAHLRNKQEKLHTKDKLNFQSLIKSQQVERR